MVRLLIALALFWPLAAGAGSKKKHHHRDDVEIWPPPAPGTDQAGAVLPPPPKAPEPPPDAGDPYTLDPAVLNDPPTETPKPAAADDSEDVCADAFSACSEDCIVAHATDDTLHVKPGAKLPIQICEGRCRKRRSICREQKRIGIDQNDPHRQADEDLAE